MANSLLLGMTGGLIFGIAVVLWVAPDSNGTVFIVTISMIGGIAIGTSVNCIFKSKQKRQRKPSRR
jgi:hypothetical protein